MLNMISAEIYKTVIRAYTKIFLIICCVLVAVFAFLMRWNMPEVVLNSGRASLFSVYICLMTVPFFLTIITSDMVFSEENKHNTMKNVVAFGYTRTQIYFSKLVVAVINFMVMALIVLAVSILSVLICFPDGEGWKQFLCVYLWSFLVSVPLWLSQAAVIMAGLWSCSRLTALLDLALWPLS